MSASADSREREGTGRGVSPAELSFLLWTRDPKPQSQKSSSSFSGMTLSVSCYLTNPFFNALARIKLPFLDLLNKTPLTWASFGVDLADIGSSVHLSEIGERAKIWGHLTTKPHELAPALDDFVLGVAYVEDVS